MLTIALTAMGAATHAVAHHSFSMFDSEKRVKVVGTVVKFDWANPHSHILVEVPKEAADPSTVGTWDVEAAPPNILTRQGWTKRSFQPGDKITAVGSPMRDGTKAMALSYALDPAGKQLWTDVNRREPLETPAAKPAAPAPKP